MKIHVAIRPLTVSDGGERQVVPAGTVLDPAYIAGLSANGLRALMVRPEDSDARIVEYDTDELLRVFAEFEEAGYGQIPPLEQPQPERRDAPDKPARRRKKPGGDGEA